MRFHQRSSEVNPLKLRVRPAAAAAELEARLGRTLNVRYESGRSFDVPVSILDVTLAGSVLGWSPRLSLQDGIARTLRDLDGNAALSLLD